MLFRYDFIDCMLKLESRIIQRTNKWIKFSRMCVQQKESRDHKKHVYAVVIPRQHTASWTQQTFRQQSIVDNQTVDVVTTARKAACLETPSSPSHLPPSNSTSLAQRRDSPPSSQLSQQPSFLPPQLRLASVCSDHSQRVAPTSQPRAGNSRWP